METIKNYKNYELTRDGSTYVIWKNVEFSANVTHRKKILEVYDKTEALSLFEIIPNINIEVHNETEKFNYATGFDKINEERDYLVVNTNDVELLKGTKTECQAFLRGLEYADKLIDSDIWSECFLSEVSLKGGTKDSK